MAKQNKSESVDYHKKTTTFTVRIDRDLLDIFDAKHEQENRSRNEVILEWIENYCFDEEE